jgi:hypothetical protein
LIGLKECDAMETCPKTSTLILNPCSAMRRREGNKIL